MTTRTTSLTTCLRRLLVPGLTRAEFAGALGARLGLRLVLVYVVSGLPPVARESVTGRQDRTGAERTLEAIARRRAATLSS
jgi:hypothetical protein